MVAAADAVETRAERLGVYPAAVTNWKKGRRVPPPETLAKLRAVVRGVLRSEMSDQTGPALSPGAQDRPERLTNLDDYALGDAIELRSGRARAVGACVRRALS
jgi:hypothetical protein